MSAEHAHAFIHMATKKKKTSWGKVATWYDEYLEGEKDSYQRQVILPNLVRLVAPRKGLRVLDIACGQGFSRAHSAKRARQPMALISLPSLSLLPVREVPPAEFFTLRQRMIFLSRKTRRTMSQPPCLRSRILKILQAYVAKCASATPPEDVSLLS